MRRVDDAALVADPLGDFLHRQPGRDRLVDEQSDQILALRAVDLLAQDDQGRVERMRRPGTVHPVVVGHRDAIQPRRPGPLDQLGRPQRGIAGVLRM